MTGRRLLVFGAGGHGKVVADVGRSAGLEVVAFVDDAPEKQGAAVLGLPVLSWDSIVAAPARYAGIAVALGVGDNRLRETCRKRIVEAGFEVATLIHASAVVAPTARLGAGTVVMALVAVNPDARVGEGGILNTGSVVEHDCLVNDFVHLSPNCALGGTVRVGRCTHVGIGASVLPGIEVGAYVRVGAGAVVTRPVPDGQTVVGVPARPAKPHG